MMTGATFITPPGVPQERVQILREAIGKVYKDPEFYKDYKKMMGEEPSPLMPEEFDAVMKKLQRDREDVELFKKIADTGPLPAHSYLGSVKAAVLEESTPTKPRSIGRDTIRSHLVLEVASELVDRSEWPYRQAQIHLREQGGETWPVCLFGSDSPAAIDQVARGELQVAIINPSAPLSLAGRV